MPLIQIEYIYLAIALATACGVGAGFFFRRGKKEGIDESCAKRIEGKLDSLEKTLNDEIANTDESHRQMHEKINSIKAELAYIKGVVDNHIDSKSD